MMASLADDSKLVLSDKDKERLNDLYPDWETLKDKTKDKEHRKKAKSEINNKIVEIKNSIARIENDTEDKIKVDEAKLLKPSETEIIQFDRFILSWR